MVVLELGGLQDKPALLAAVMFSLIIYIEDKMYRTDRSLKRCAPSMKAGNCSTSKREGGAFIETGYRTVRRHTGAFITISQNIKDFDADDASSAAKAAWGNSAFKVVLKQDTMEFKQYNQNRPNQFSELERQVISKFGDAKRQWFLPFMLRINDSSSFIACLSTLSRAMFSSNGKDFEFLQQRRADGLIFTMPSMSWHYFRFPEEMEVLKHGNRNHRGRQAPLSLAHSHPLTTLLLLNLALSGWLLWQRPPAIVAFDMKATLDQFMEQSASQQLSETQSKVLVERFSQALDDSLSAWQQQHDAPDPGLPVVRAP